ncbi:hypothetical protein HYT25_02090 [Candidatus Pacearchaeota archaeon]|nr:hypothetical protein [Candidatus Pacearchaeota archaeon]
MEDELIRKLDERYIGCDIRGHRLPNPEKTYCNSCFRRLNYNATNGLSERDQRSLDKLAGLTLLRKELLPAGKLLSR